MPQTLKIAIPMAGLGTRLRPHTWTRPKPLLHLAGRTVLDYVLDQFNTLPDPENVEYIFIVGPQGDQVKAFMEQHYPKKKAHYVRQDQMRGQSDALHQARDFLTGPMLMAFADTLVESDLGFLQGETMDIVAWVKAVPDPSRYGVAQINARGMVTRLIEKPSDYSSNLAVVGPEHQLFGARAGKGSAFAHTGHAACASLQRVGRNQYHRPPGDRRAGQCAGRGRIRRIHRRAHAAPLSTVPADLLLRVYADGTPTNGAGFAIGQYRDLSHRAALQRQPGRAPASRIRSGKLRRRRAACSRWRKITARPCAPRLCCATSSISSRSTRSIPRRTTA